MVRLWCLDPCRNSAVEKSELDTAALSWLPSDWHDGPGSGLTALALWGLTEGGIKCQRYGPDTEQLESAVLHLMEADNEAAIQWIELGLSDSECVLTAAELRSARSANHAAARVLEVIGMWLVEGRPLPPLQDKWDSK